MLSRGFDVSFPSGYTTSLRISWVGGPPISPLAAGVISVASFHGRGLFPAGFAPTFPMAVLGACEAIIGLTIEISFIATFTQRYFGK